jgi:hypothetical protein
MGRGCFCRDRKLQAKRQGYQKVKQEVAKGGAAQKDTSAVVMKRCFELVPGVDLDPWQAQNVFKTEGD